MSPARTLAKTEYEICGSQTHDPPLVGYIALPNELCSHVTVERVLPAQKYRPPSESISPMKLFYLLPLPHPEVPDDVGTSYLPAIPAVALTVSPPHSSLRYAARSRSSPKRLDPQT